MSYEEQSKQIGRSPIEFVELTLDQCQNEFNTATCAGTGEPCYKTWATCKAKSDYKQGTKSYYFVNQRSDTPIGFDAFSLLQSVQYAPQQLTPGKGLGVRGAVTVKMTDSVWPDHLLDPYFESRPEYDEDELGTFWGRFLARNKYHQNRFLKVLTGYLRDDGRLSFSDFKSRAYIIEKITGPDRNGSISIVAKDILKLADNERAKCPLATSARLGAEITATQTSFKIYPAGTGDKEFKSSGYLRISGEIMAFTRIGDTFTVQRGALNTEAKVQDVDSTVQQAAIFNEQRVQDIIYSLLVDYAGVPAQYINKPIWNAESSKYLKGVFSAIITEPVGVNTLIAELCEQGQCYIWWDEVEQQIRFKALLIPADGLVTYNDNEHFLADSLTASIDTESRQSRFIVYFDLIDPTKKLDEASNYRQRHIGADLQSETNEEYGAVKSKIIYSRWFNGGSFGRVQALTTALLTRYRDPPRLLNFDLDAAEPLKTGDYFYAMTKTIQNVKGKPAVLPMQVMEMQENKAGSVIKFKATELVAVEQQEQPDGDVIITGEVFDINLRAMYEAEFGPPSETGEITFYVSSSCFICSSSAYRPQLTNKRQLSFGDPVSISEYPETPEIPAIDTGNFPANLIVNLVIAGAVVGRGGDGAFANSGKYDPAGVEQRNGYAGAPGLRNRHNKLRIILDGGVLARGGSGGGSGANGIGKGVSISGTSGGGGAPYGRVLSGVAGDPNYTGYRYFQGVSVLFTTDATKDTPGQGMIISYSSASGFMATPTSGKGGEWGKRGSPGDQSTAAGYWSSQGIPSGLPGPGGPAIIGTAPLSIETKNGGQILETI